MKIPGVSVLVATLALACASPEAEQATEMCAVTLMVSADLQLPQGGTLTLDEAYLVMGDFAFFGNELAEDDVNLDGLLTRLGRFVLPRALAHAGHSHGAAEVEGSLDGIWAVPLGVDPVAVGSFQMAQGHYFDGRLSLFTAGPDSSAELLSNGVIPSSGVTFHLRGTAATSQGDLKLEFDVPLESTVAGLELASYALVGQDNSLELRVMLGRIVGALNLPTLANGEGRIVIGSSEDEGVDTLRIALKDRLNYEHVTTQP